MLHVNVSRVLPPSGPDFLRPGPEEVYLVHGLHPSLPGRALRPPFRRRPPRDPAATRPELGQLSVRVGDSNESQKDRRLAASLAYVADAVKRTSGFAEGYVRFRGVLSISARAA